MHPQQVDYLADWVLSALLLPLVVLLVYSPFCVRGRSAVWTLELFFLQLAMRKNSCFMIIVRVQARQFVVTSICVVQLPEFRRVGYTYCNWLLLPLCSLMGLLCWWTSQLRIWLTHATLLEYYIYYLQVFWVIITSWSFTRLRYASYVICRLRINARTVLPLE